MSFFFVKKFLFHKFGISSLAKPSDAFEIDTRSPAFSDLHKFLEFRPETADTQSQLFQLIGSYQQLLSYLKEQNKIDVLVATEVERLQAMNQHGLGSDKIDILMKRYEELAEIYVETTESTLALHQLAMLHRENDDLVQAMEICNKAINSYGVSDGAQLCRNLQNQIMQSEYEIQIEHSINSSNSELFVNYRNVKKLYFRVYKRELVQNFGS